jgi:hypothetical protein
MLVELGGCVFDANQLKSSHGYERLDLIGREAFVNHMHLTNCDREAEARRIIEAWATELSARWPNSTFRIYRDVEVDEVTIRFHMVRPGEPNWCEEGVEVIVVGGESI